MNLTRQSSIVAAGGGNSILKLNGNNCTARIFARRQVFAFCLRINIFFFFFFRCTVGFHRQIYIYIRVTTVLWDGFFFLFFCDGRAVAPRCPYI